MTQPRTIRPGPVVVIGSANMDLVCRTARLPSPGETLLASHFSTIPGGKGANQAVAAARLDAETHFIARVGDDPFGQQLLTSLRASSVHTDHVHVTPSTPSGTAIILVDTRGQNSIVVSPGANAKLSPRDIDAAQPLLARASVAVLQLEIPIATVRHAIRLCRKLGVFTILDPAPVPPKGLPSEVLAVDVLTPNETEAQAILGIRASTANHAQPEAEIAANLLKRGPIAIVLKLGRRGALLLDKSNTKRRYTSFKVDVIDTTAAGDAFTAALAAGIAQGKPLEEIIPFANAAGALTCTALGAQTALPRRADVERLVRRDAMVRR